MPTSTAFTIPHIISRVLELQPKSVLDIGIGFGKYGFLLREYLDIGPGRYTWEKWKARIDGIEIYPEYVGGLQRLVYDKIYIGDALDVLSRVERYDLILLIATLEHFSKDKGVELLKLIKEKSQVALVYLPEKIRSIGGRDSTVLHGNVYEMHRCQWTREELERFGQVRVIVFDNKQTVFLLEIGS